MQPVLRFFRKPTMVALPGDLIFREIQRFRDTWLWPALVIPAVLASLYVVYVLIKVFFLEDTAGGFARNAVGLGIAFYVLKGFGSLMALLYAARLEIEVSTAGLFFRIAPFQRKFRHVPAEELRDADVQSARLPVRRGWRIYAVKGAKAVQLRTKTGHQMLLGTQHPDRLAVALNR